MRILIAEDDLTSRKILSSVIEKKGYEPVVAEDGEQAWQILQEADAPKLLLLDWNMPGMDGIEVCTRLRDIECDNPSYIILLTARGGKDDVVKGLEAGANDYIAKPYNAEELAARIRVGRRMLELQADLLSAQENLQHLALHDPLTGLFNRRGILNRLEAEVARADRTQHHLSIGMCDLDHFKQINDEHGHQTGDLVLRALADCLQSALRNYDCVGRIGGEEFLVIAPDSAGGADEGLYERLRSTVEDLQIQQDGRTLSVAISIGVAPYRLNATPDTMLADADKALYRAKNNGRNRVVYA